MIGRKLRAKKVNEGIEMPRYAHEGDAGLDLRITEDVTLEPMQKCVVGCGLAVEIPSGCVGLVFPRSGLAAKQGITLSNSVGVIDSGYRGEVCAALINQSYETVTLESGTRVCQLVVMPYVPCELVPVDELSDTERGMAENIELMARKMSVQIPPVLSLSGMPLKGSLMHTERVLVDELGLVAEYLIGAEVVSASIDGVALVKAQPPSADLAKLGLWEAFKLWREERKRARSGGDGM